MPSPTFFVISSNTTANKCGLRTDPWWTRIFTSNHSDLQSSNLTAVLTPSYISIIAFTSLSTIPFFLISNHITLLGTRSKVFFQIHKIHIKLSLATPYFSTICRTEKIASIMPFPGTNPFFISCNEAIFLSRSPKIFPIFQLRLYI